MKARTGNQDDGIIGLGVLVLMAIALVAGQAHGSRESATSLALAPAVEAPLLDRSSIAAPASDAAGAIRELRILPSFINEAADLDWSSDDELLDTYRKSAF